MDSPADFDSYANAESAIRKQLSVYQSLNTDLSKKIQKLKIEANLQANEINKIKLELIDERKKSAELRQLFFSANSHCVDFFKAYFDTIQQMNEFPDVSFELPDQNTSQNPELTTARQSLLRGNLVTNANTQGEYLEKITEESLLLQTSTPLQPTATFTRKLHLVRHSLDSLLTTDEPTIMQASSNNVTERSHSDDESSSDSEKSPVKQTITTMPSVSNKYEESEKDGTEDENDGEGSPVKTITTMPSVSNKNEESEKDESADENDGEGSPVKTITTMSSVSNKNEESEKDESEEENDSDNKSRGKKKPSKLTKARTKSKKTVKRKAVEQTPDLQECQVNITKLISTSNEDEESEEEKSEAKTLATSSKTKAKNVLEKENVSVNKNQQEKAKLKKAVKRKVVHQTLEQQEEEETTAGRSTRQRPRKNYAEKPLGTKLRRD